MISVTWTGAAGLRFDTGDDIILVDPYYSKVGRRYLFLGRATSDEAAVSRYLSGTDALTSIIVSHTHFDHALDIPAIAPKCKGDIVGSPSLDTLLGLHGQSGRTTICHGGETVQLSDDCEVTMLSSVHGRVVLGRVPFTGEISLHSRVPLKLSEYRTGQVFSPKLTLKGTVFLHVGSAGFVESALDNHYCDVLFLCVAGWNRFSGYPERIIEMTRPQTVVLFHYDDFFRHHHPGRRTKTLRFLKMDALARKITTLFPQIRLRVPDVDEAMSF